jgi:hypothetical protein
VRRLARRIDLDSHMTPDEILLEEYLKPIGISHSAMARGVPLRLLCQFVSVRSLGRRTSSGMEYR